MRNPYAVLGIPKTASGDEIKAAFRKKAKSSHPDRNQNNPRAASRFNDVNHAYEILGNAKKRRLFDSGQIDSSGRATPRKSVFSGFAGVNPWNGFSFKRSKNSSAAADEAKRDKPADAASEADKGGFENDSHEEIMERIFGESFVRKTAEDAPGLDDHPEPEPETQQVDEADIHAELAISLDRVLKTSSESVTLPDGRTVKVNLPAGIENGRVLRLHGKGKNLPEDKMGDALITIRYKKHKYLRTDGVDLVADLPVPLKDGILGAKVPFEGLDGKLLVSIPPWSGSDRVLRIRGKGLPDSNKRRGDLYINVKLLLPEDPDDALLAYAKSTD
ncbi:DnaJ C-terminal domain-containing protein [Hoeflea poritis]|uniref:DnaJ domain-containing protein n=1 Tax=Hoeflea poritis TaxID=2993659 RepID=A0ABT4VJF5_9HYPH|nr:DnaJ C-terminal domain-containing protein [Hoeflea poritis]MDA4844828.1 DnaJ domain-containing protein [Hoeflea poritis]